MRYDRFYAPVAAYFQEVEYVSNYLMKFIN